MIREDAPDRLLVEGADDKHSIINLMMRHNVDWDSELEALPFVRDCGGIDLLLDSVSVSAKSYQRLGVMIDANEEIQTRWEQVRQRFASVGVQLSSIPNVAGTIVQGIFPDWKVGVWIMPDNSAKGKLEDFLKTLVPSTERCWAYAKEATKHAKEIGAAFPSKKSLKACIHTWLSWQAEPGLPFGTAITAKYFAHDSPEALKFVDWFTRLFLSRP